MRCSRCTYQNADPVLFDAHFTANHWPEPIESRVRVSEVDVLPLASEKRLVYYRPERTYKASDGSQWFSVEL